MDGSVSGRWSWECGNCACKVSIGAILYAHQTTHCQLHNIESVAQQVHIAALPGAEYLSVPQCLHAARACCFIDSTVACHSQCTQAVGISCHQGCSNVEAKMECGVGDVHVVSRPASATVHRISDVRCASASCVVPMDVITLIAESYSADV